MTLFAFRKGSSRSAAANTSELQLAARGATPKNSVYSAEYSNGASTNRGTIYRPVPVRIRVSRITCSKRTPLRGSARSAPANANSTRHWFFSCVVCMSMGAVSFLYRSNRASPSHPLSAASAPKIAGTHCLRLLWVPNFSNSLSGIVISMVRRKSRYWLGFRVMSSPVASALRQEAGRKSSGSMP